MKIRARAVLFVAALLAAIVSCKPREGGPCTLAKALCTGPNEGLFCERVGSGPAKLRRYECRGPKGCYADGALYRCDQSVSAEGDACDTTAGGASCGADGKTLLECVAGTMEKAQVCRGPGGCLSSAGRVACDRSVAEPGDPCTPDNEGKSACTPDHTARVDCISGTHVIQTHCDGPKGCSADAGAIVCDGERGIVGGRCEGEGLAECGPGGTAIMHCRANRFVADGRQCFGANGCYRLSGKILCDQSIAEVGYACGDEGETSCSKDGTATVVCKSGAFAPGRKCAGGCNAAKTDQGFIASVRCR